MDVDMRQQRRAAIRNLFAQRRSPECRAYLRRVIDDCRALEQPFRGREAARERLGLPPMGYNPPPRSCYSMFAHDCRPVSRRSAAQHRAEQAGLALHGR